MRVLIIDDDPISRMTLTGILQSFLNLPIEEASSFDEGMSQLNTCIYYPLVVCDVNLGPSDGISLIESANKTGLMKGVEPILATASPSKEAVLRAQRNGIKQFILKPFDGDAIEIKVTELWRSHYDVLFEAEEQAARRLRSSLPIYRDMCSYQKGRILSLSPDDLSKEDVMALYTGCVNLGMQASAFALLNIYRCLISTDQANESQRFLEKALADLMAQQSFKYQYACSQDNG